MPVRHLLLDADGVLQRTGGPGWWGRLEERAGERTEELVARLTELEGPRLTGGGDLLEDLRVVMADLGLAGDPEELYAAVWLDVEPLSGTLEVVEAVRAAGVEVHLATNQHLRRAAHMQQRLGYDALLGRGFYSCELGVAKPDPAFFTAAARALGASLDELLLVDDSAVNVDGAQEAGAAAVRWHHDEGIPVLRERLARHGLTLDGPGTS